MHQFHRNSVIGASYHSKGGGLKETARVGQVKSRVEREKEKERKRKEVGPGGEAEVGLLQNLTKPSIVRRQLPLML